MTPLLAQRLRTDRSFERLYRRHVRDVYHYALAICRHPSDAEDVTQTTFMNAYRAVQAGEQPRAPKNWLLTIAHNVMRQRFRQSARRPDEVELDDGFAAAVPDDEGYSAEDIRRALGELAFNQRAALVMRELEGRSYAEIAEILGLSMSAVETVIFRARRALREQLEGSLSCHEAELAISRQLDGRLPRAEKGSLRAHLRTCKECASFARSQRAQRAALKGLAAIPLPSSLASFFGGGGAAVGTGVAVKAATVTAVGLLVSGAGVETARVVRAEHSARSAEAKRPALAASQVAAAATADRKEIESAPRARAAPPPARADHGRARPQRRREARVGYPQAAEEAQTPKPGRAKQAKPEQAVAPAKPSKPARAANEPGGRGHGKAYGRKPDRAKHGSGAHGKPDAPAAGAIPPPAPPSGAADQGNGNGNGGQGGEKGKEGSADEPKGNQGVTISLPGVSITVPEPKIPVKP